MLSVGAGVAAADTTTTIYTISVGSFLWLAIPIIICMFLIRFLYLRFSKNGKKFVEEKRRRMEEDILTQNLEKNIQNGIVDKLVDLTNSNYAFNELVQSMAENSKIISGNVKERNNVPKNFICTFSAEAPFILRSVSESFITLNNVRNFDELKMKYNSRNIIRSAQGKPLSATGIIALESGNDNIQLALQDVFKIEQSILDELVDNITIHIVNNMNSLICENVRMRLLTTDAMGAEVHVISDFYFVDGELIVKFTIEKFIPKISSRTDTLDVSSYKNVMRNIILDVEYPILLVDDSGIRFMNKCTCDWFNIPYDRIDEVQNSELASKTFDDIFSTIDACLPSLIRKTLKSSDNTGFYTECVINNKMHKLDGLSISKVPMEVIVHAVPFTSENRRRLIITIQSTNAIHEYISKNDSASQRMDKDVSEFVTRITSVNEIFRAFFHNTRMVSFGRIDVNTRNVIACNDSFEELLKYDDKKKQYKAIIDSILAQYIAQSESEVNFYVYTVNYSDRETTIVYSYNSNVVDIVFLDRHVRSFLSNNSIELLGRFYQTSDLPIVVVDKTAHILNANKQFEVMFMQEYVAKQITEGGKVSFLEFVPQKERNKIKRAIYDAVKFNCYNLNDVIIMNHKHDKSKSCALSCIKTYSKINGEEFITITIFPNDKDKGADE